MSTREGRLASLRTSRRWMEERRGEVLAEDAPKKGDASSSWWSRRSWLCGRRDVEAEDMAAKEKEGGEAELGKGGAEATLARWPGSTKNVPVLVRVVLIS